MSTPTTRRGTPPAGLSARLRSDPRLQAPGWVLLPLRLFLGVTFAYAGLSKITDDQYLDHASPNGVHAQMVRAAATSPIGWLVTLSAEHSTVTGLLIAFGELAVGVGALLGLLTRLSALGGMLLALSFFLTVSWTTSPYYYGADIGYLFAWTPLLLGGDGGVYSLGAAIRTDERRKLGLPEYPGPRETLAVLDEVERRTLVRSGVIAAVVGGITVVGGSAFALIRRPTGSGAATTTPSPSPAVRRGTPSPAASAGSSAAASAPPANTIATVSEVAVGSAKAFTAPNGDPAYVLQPKAGTFVALSAICTHQGCQVMFAGNGFQCPCHGATYDDQGQVTGGPAPQALSQIPITVQGQNIVVTG